MKVIVDTKETGQKEGLEALMGEKVLLLCMNYFYAGELVGVNDTQIKLKNAFVVYETGEFTAKKWANAEQLPSEFTYVYVDKIEAYCASVK